LMSKMAMSGPASTLTPRLSHRTTRLPLPHTLQERVPAQLLT
jgi:hypothetical protein